MYALHIDAQCTREHQMVIEWRLMIDAILLDNSDKLLSVERSREPILALLCTVYAYWTQALLEVK